MEQQYQTIGKVEQNIMRFLEQTTPKENHEYIKKILKEYNIKEADIEFVLIHENETEKLYTFRIKGYDDDLYHRIPK